MDLNSLPLVGFNRLDSSVAMERARWTETLLIINQARNARITIGEELQQNLDDLQYLAKQALFALRVAVSPAEPALGTPQLQEIKDQFLRALPKAQLLWSRIQNEAGGFGDTEGMTQSLMELSKPKSTSDLFLGALLAGGLLLAVYAAKR